MPETVSAMNDRPDGGCIPVIDLSAALAGAAGARAATAHAIRAACRDTGFFYVVGHGVDPVLIDEQFAWAKRFFDLPDAHKRGLDMKRSAANAGYEPIGAQILDSQEKSPAAAPADLKESFYIGTELPDDHPLAKLKIRGFGHNQWPADLPEFRGQMLEYQTAMHGLGNRLLELIALSLGLPEAWFERFFAVPVQTLRLIKYPPRPRDALEGQLGAGAHTDWGGITILAQDMIGGLEVRTVRGAWVDARPVGGSFIINLGDLMARWTNGVYMSNMHRVRTNVGERDRYSVPYFFSPNPDALITAIPTCVDAQRPRMFADCTASEHVSDMFARSYGYRPSGAPAG